MFLIEPSGKEVKVTYSKTFNAKTFRFVIERNEAIAFATQVLNACQDIDREELDEKITMPEIKKFKELTGILKVKK